MNGIDCFFEGARLVWRPGIRTYVIVPFILNTIVFIAVVGVGISQMQALTEWISGMLPEWLAFLAGVLTAIAGIAAFLVFVLVFAIIASVISSPFLALLSEKVEEALTGERPTATANMAVVFFRALGREVQKLLYYLPRLIGVFLLTLIPVINVASPVLWVLFGAWMMTIQYVDYAADNNSLGFADLRDRLGATRFQAMMFGLVVYVALAVPILNLILIPIAVAGGTVFYVERLRTR